MATLTKLLLLLVLVFAQNVIGHAAPLICKGQRLTPVETMICSDAKLSDYEERLNILFHKAITVSVPHEQRKILDEQRLWLTNARDRCDTWLCLHGAYQARLDSISQTYHDRLKSKISGDVMIDLLRHSASSAEERKEILNNCAKNQTSMNFCSFRLFVKTDLAMSAVFASKLEALPTSCRERLRTDQAKWEIERDNKCNKEADEKAGSSSMRQMIFTTCQAEFTEQRTTQLESIKSCDAIREGRNLSTSLISG